MCDFITSPAIHDIDSEQAILFVKAIERYAYQGFPEFAIYTMLMNDFRSLWEEKCQQEGYKALANIRAYFQQEVDSIIREDSERNRKLFDSVRMIEGLPESKDVLFTNNTFWMLGGAIELNIGKILGIMLMQITKARSIEEFARLASKTIVDMLFNYDTINIAIIEWYKAHDPAWNTASIEKINRMLDIAQQRAFTQLRGAAELSLSFAIIKGHLNNHAVVELARSDRAESRQFLSDVLQTMFVSGHRSQVTSIIELLIADDSNSAKILAMQASYQMKLDNYLIRLCIAKSEFVRNMAILFLYQRWNKARLEGRLQDGYDPLHQIASKIRLNHPQTSLQYVTTLSFLSLNMIAHAIDDKKSLIPLIEIWKDLARKVPGIQADAKGRLYATINKIMFGGIVEVVTQIIKYTVRGSVLDDLNHFWSNQK